MAKKKPKKTRKKKTSAKNIPSKMDIGSVEKNTIQRVNHTITVIEKFLARWNAAKKKPEHITPHIERMKKFHKELVKWQKNAIKAQKKSDEAGRVKRLRNFILLCNTYSQV